MKTLDVIIVTKDRYPRLLRVITALLTNTVPPDRIILIDSSTGSDPVGYAVMLRRLLKRSGIPFIYRNVPHRGIGYSRRIGISLVRSDLLAFIDDDQVPLPNWVRTVKRYFRSDPGPVALGGVRRPRFPGNYWNRIWWLTEQSRYANTASVNFIPTGNGVFVRDFIRRHKITFREFKGVIEDVDFCDQIIARGGTIAVSSEVIVLDDFRTSLTAFLSQWRAYGQGTCSVWRRSLVRSHSPVPYIKAYLGAMESLAVVRSPMRYYWGIVLRNTAFSVGFWTEFLSDL